MRGLILGLLIGLTAPALAQEADPYAGTVTWTAAADTGAAVKPGGRINLVLNGAVQEGWHVYGLKQLPAGPTPLKVALVSRAIAKADGAPRESKPSIIHDPGFDLQTQFHTYAFTVTLPLRLARAAQAGAQAIAVDVRYQTCSDRICQPPRTAHLSAPITIAAE